MQKTLIYRRKDIDILLKNKYSEFLDANELHLQKICNKMQEEDLRCWM